MGAGGVPCECRAGPAGPSSIVGDKYGSIQDACQELNTLVYKPWICSNLLTSWRLALDLNDFLLIQFFTGRNEVVAKVMFIHVSVILLTGGRVSGEPPQTKETPPGRGTPPPGPRRTPPGKNTAAYGQ